MAKVLFLVTDERFKETIRNSLVEFSNHSLLEGRGSEDCEFEIRVFQDLENIDRYFQGADILVARGVMVPLLRKTYPDRPVVELTITTIDVVKAVFELRKTHPERKPIALVGFRDAPSQLQLAASICGETLEPFRYFSDKVDLDGLSSMIDEAVMKGFTQFLGGARTVALARSRGLAAEVITNGPESILPAIAEATHIARIRRMERERAARFETILNHVSEGIIATDAGDRIVRINAAAAEMTGLDPGTCAGTPLEKVIPDPRLFTMLRDERACRDELIAMAGQRFVLSKSAIQLEGSRIGNLVTIQRVSAVQDTEKKIRSKLYRRGLTAKYSFSDIVGESPSLKEAIRKASVFARTSSSVLINGETGTGKELFAQSIHRASARREGPFVAVNCAAIPENLIESEFFGHEGGAFTGALREGRPGYFELAHEGTIFLDEVSEIPLNLQGKLLRVIQENELMRIGSDRVVAVDIRIVCAVNRDLRALVRAGKFREDLYFRLAVLQLELPPLRDRGGDVMLLTERFLRRFETAFGKGRIRLAEEAEKVFMNHAWAGNIRELGNVCEQLAVLDDSGVVSGEDAAALLASRGENGEGLVPALSRYREERGELERSQILRALGECGCNRTKAASQLGMDRSTLWRKIKEHGIELKSSASTGQVDRARRGIGD